ncbi:alpha,alpha-phosphotrehalase [Spiroplasma endosymbiont of Anurida maritima]|uniref:alpha,alpha-phosphotrehalase n=1 Tax=Spiroplasma endosymbiont of Anurida maritima TaxID=2967972 RepID=UPI0036D2171B
MKQTNFKKAIIYEIHPQSFKDTNNDGIGDISGIIEKIPYLSKLGINYIWLNPIYLSPLKDNGYDVKDYKKIDPRFGTLNDLKKLIKIAKNYNIKIMMDMIFNHCSTEHIWFKKALKGNKKYINRFFFLNSKNKQPPTNWKSKFGGSAWEFSPELNRFYLHLFDKTQADLNWSDKHLQKDMHKILNFWIKLGVKGFRMDVINLISKPKIFIDDLNGDGRKFYTDANDVHNIIKSLNKNVFSKKNDLITVGELSSTNIANLVKYTHKDSNELDMAFSFLHLKIDYKNNNKWEIEKYDPKNLVNIIIKWQAEIQNKGGWIANFLNNHDQPRALSRFGDVKNYRFESATALASITLLLRSTPFIYQGEEFGMENNSLNSIKDFRDVESINYYHEAIKKGLNKKEILKILNQRSRDNARTPMQWSNKKYAGFSTTEPWIKVNKNYQNINFKQDATKKYGSIFKNYQNLISIRKNNLEFIEGKIDFIQFDPCVLSFYRAHKDIKTFVLINLSDKNISLSENFNNIKKEKIIYNNYQTITSHLQPFQSIVFKE